MTFGVGVRAAADRGPLVVVAGIRAQYMKLAALQLTAPEWTLPWLFIDTGQHYDASLATQYVDEYNLRFDHRLMCGASGRRPAAVFARMIESLDELFDEIAPLGVVVFGDANTTLAGALAAGRRNIPVAHVEAGLRTGAATPEEFNRVLVDKIASLHLASCMRDLDCLRNEGCASTSHLAGDLIRDLCALSESDVIVDDALVLVSLHRAEHTEDSSVIRHVLQAVDRAGLRTLFLAHPRVEPMVLDAARQSSGSVVVRTSVPHRELLGLMASARLVITDSGALQRESFYVGRRAVVVQDRPFWQSLVDAGYHVAVGPSGDIDDAIARALAPTSAIVDDFGEVPVARTVVALLENWAAELGRR